MQDTLKVGHDLDRGSSLIKGKFPDGLVCEPSAANALATEPLS